jgi:hypothetical protein
MADPLPIFKVEVEYNYDKEPKNNWYYYFGEAKTLELALKNAEKHFNEMVVSSGWKNKVKVIAIRKITGPDTKAKTVVVEPEPVKKKAGPKRVAPVEDKEDTPTKPVKKKAEISRKGGAGTVRRPRKSTKT